MAFSKTQICNIALSHIGTYTISEFDTDRSEPGNKCRILYDQARLQTLRDFMPSFAEKREYLNLLTAVTPVGYTYAYQYPTYCLRAKQIYRSANYTDPIDFVITANDDNSSRMILTDEVDAILIYTRDIENTSVYDPSFVTAFSWRLAQDLAIPLTKKQTVHDMCSNRYILQISAADASDAQEKRTDKIKVSNRYVTARS